MRKAVRWRQKRVIKWYQRLHTWVRKGKDEKIWLISNIDWGWKGEEVELVYLGREEENLWDNRIDRRSEAKNRRPDNWLGRPWWRRRGSFGVNLIQKSQWNWNEMNSLRAAKCTACVKQRADQYFDFKARKVASNLTQVGQWPPIFVQPCLDVHRLFVFEGNAWQMGGHFWTKTLHYCIYTLCICN